MTLTDRKSLALLLHSLSLSNDTFLADLNHKQIKTTWHACRSTRYIMSNNIPISNLTKTIVHNILPWRSFRAKRVSTSIYFTNKLLYLYIYIYNLCIYIYNIYIYIYIYIYNVKMQFPYNKVDDGKPIS